MRSILTGADSKAMVSVLKPTALHFAPTSGLMYSCADILVRNLLSCEIPVGMGLGIGSSCTLSRELFLDTSAETTNTRFGNTQLGAIRATNLRSLPAAYLTPPLLGHILGLAVTTSTQDEIRKGLRAVGVTTNRVNGEWTGVSLARHERLVMLLQQSLRESQASPALPLFLRFLWQRTTSKRQVLDYYLALDSHLPIFSQDSLRTSELAQQEWVEQRFTMDDLSDDSAAAACRLLGNIDSTRTAATSSSWSPQHAHALEVLAASLGASHAFKPAVRIQRHRYKGCKEVGDCVEVVLRELIDAALWDSDTASFDIGKLPSSASPVLVDFYRDVVAEVISSDELSKQWFSLCQNIDGCEYLLTAPDGSRYEMKPLKTTLMRAAGWLLTGKNVGWSTVIDLKSIYPDLIIEESIEVNKSMMSEERNVIELALVKTKGARHSLEIRLEAAHNIATCTYFNEARPWASASVALHERSWQRQCEARDISPMEAAVSAAWPALLGHRLLNHIGYRPQLGHIALAALCYQWEGHNMWMPFEEQRYMSTPTVDDKQKAEQAKMKAAGRIRLALEQLMKSCSHPDDIMILLAWLDKVAPPRSSTGYLEVEGIRKLFRNVFGFAS